MKTFNTYIIEKLKVSPDSKIDLRDDDTVEKLYGNNEDKEKFKKYLHDCLNRDRYNIQIHNIEFIHDRVMLYHDSISRILCKFSEDDTYIGLYNRIIDALKEKHFITEKLKVSKTIRTNDLFKHLENVKDINQTNYGRLKYEYISSEADFDKFYAYWFYTCESKYKNDPKLLSRLTEYIQLTFNDEGVFIIYDLETGDEITRWGDHPKEKEEPIAFPTAKFDILEYFENIYNL